MLVELPGVLSEIDFRETNFRVVNSPRMLHRAGSPRASAYRRCIDDVKIRFQPFARDGWARALGRGGDDDGRGVEIALFRGVADAGSLLINSDREILRF